MSAAARAGRSEQPPQVITSTSICHRLAFIFRGETIAVGTPERIVADRELAVVELEVDRGVVAADLLRGRPRIDEVAHFGHVLRVASRGVPDPLAHVRAMLEDGGVEIRRAALARASVEDAFVSMVREDEAQAETRAA